MEAATSDGTALAPEDYQPSTGAVTFATGETAPGSSSRLSGSLWVPPTQRTEEWIFQDIAAGDGAGISYRRQESPSDDKFDLIKQQPTFTFTDLARVPFKSRGAPGVAIFDFDRDGDLDLYVTNGPGAANSLYSNQLRGRPAR